MSNVLRTFLAWIYGASLVAFLTAWVWCAFAVHERLSALMGVQGGVLVLRAVVMLERRRHV